MAQVGLVAIGRNEGERLQRCLTVALQQVNRIVYVDSGSTDNSLQIARSLGVEVIELDLSMPFTAARARNAGYEYLVKHFPDVQYIQFIDGDCELVEGWLERASQALSDYPGVAVVYGRRIERDRNRTLYNRLCDMEWHNLLNYAGHCGGDAMMRVEALQQTGGFNPALIAGEEPELCLRMRQLGWQLLPLQVPMTLHDAQMMHFHQWWQRMVRAGHAYAEGAWMHGQEPERYWLKDTLSIWFWALGLPLIALFLVPFTHSLSLLLLLAYLLLSLRISHWIARQGFSWSEAILYGTTCVLGKFPNFIGQIQFYWHNLLGKPSRLIEYK
ncbi:MAG TPA: glycosyltransferase family 2 protein [Synechococcales cyanobacterium M55_K2018_004]|nr:glycosyltransferase family 2 protein [Synechococcales cyanobacterium M55_K2018_004]